MTSTVFVDLSPATPIVAAWLNDVNKAVYTAIGTGTVAPSTAAEVIANLGVPTTTQLSAPTGSTLVGAAVSTNNAGTTVQAQLTNLGSTTGTSNIGYTPIGIGAVSRTLTSKLNEIISVKDFGAVGDGITDDTVAIQACYTANPGRIISHGEGYTYLISASLTLYSGTVYTGKSIIKQKTGSNIANPMLSGSSVNNVIVKDLEIDGNATGNATALTYGIKFLTGTNNIVQGCNVHDTTQAGIYLASESYSKVLDNHIINCGRNIGTDNHGIMMISNNATPLSNIICSGNTVLNAYRKGITVYNATPGTINGVVINGNSISGCSTGGIYTANAGAATHGYQHGITVTGNYCYNNYVNIETDAMSGGVVSGNTCDTTSGGQGLVSSDCIYSSFTGNTVTNSQADGMKFIATTAPVVGLVIDSNVIGLSSQIGIGSYAGMLLNSVTYSTISCNTILGEVTTPKQSLAINEIGSSDFNLYSANRLANTSSGVLVAFVGTNNAYNTFVGKLQGINTITPLNTLDISGGISIRDQSITLSNGANNNVTLPANAGTLYVSGPTGAFDISGFSGGTSGKKLTLVNYTNQIMTIDFNSASSTAGNRILIGGSANLAINPYGSVDLTYITGASAWIMTGYKA